MLDEIIKSRSLQANGVVAFYPANREGDDVNLYRKDQGESFATFHFLRQQNKKAQNLPNFCLADFISSEKGKDHFGMFAVTAGIGLEKLIEKHKANQDDYSEIMAKALADRLAEAFAECLHERVRKELWGYAKSENLRRRIDCMKSMRVFVRHRVIRHVLIIPKRNYCLTYWMQKK
jgi:5-methyltetrahydrofolate--homocysteine methyltransferase